MSHDLETIVASLPPEQPREYTNTWISPEWVNPETMSTEELERKLREFDVLEHNLHSKECHPNYEYTYTISREAHDPVKPEGHGWVLNTHQSATGYVHVPGRLFRHEWMRLIEDAMKDILEPEHLPAVTPGQIRRLDFARKVIGFLTKLGLNNSFHHVSSEDLLNLKHGSHRYMLSIEEHSNMEAVTLRLKRGTFYFTIDLGNVQIIQAWIQPEEHATYIRSANEYGVWSKWKPWSITAHYNIDMVKVYETLIELNSKDK